MNLARFDGCSGCANFADRTAFERALRSLRFLEELVRAPTLSPHGFGRFLEEYRKSARFSTPWLAPLEKVSIFVARIVQTLVSVLIVKQSSIRAVEACEMQVFESGITTL